MKACQLISEKMFMQQVIQIATLTGWNVFHAYDSRRCPGPGFPDLTMVHPQRGFLMAELKSEHGRVTAAQQQWLDALSAAGVEVAVWRPSDLDGAIVARLTSCPHEHVQNSCYNAL